MLCAIAAQPSAAPQRRSIADRATAIYGVKRLPGEAAWQLRCSRQSVRSSKKEPAAATKATATAPPMVAVLAAVPEMLCCSESNIWEQ